MKIELNGKIAVCDFDTVSLPNPNRQAYFCDDIGKYKVEVLKETLLRINPECNVIAIKEKLSSANFAKIIPPETDIIFECFDDAVAKSELFSFCVSSRNTIPLVTVSGPAGCGPAEDIKIRKIHQRVWLVGDEKN